VKTEVAEAEAVPAVRELVSVATEVDEDVMTAEKPQDKPAEETKEPGKTGRQDRRHRRRLAPGSCLDHAAPRLVAAPLSGLRPARR
jgi:hypothetical protein